MAEHGIDALFLDEYQFQIEKPKGGNSEIPNFSLTKNPNDGKKSFAEVTAGTPLAPMFDSAVISDVGGYKSVKINQMAYEHQIQLCSNSLIGRLVLGKGDKPWKVSCLKIILTKLWNITEPWKLISLGRGYFNVFLQSRETKDRSWSRGALDLKPGIFHLQPWVPDFDPSVQNATFAQVWVRLYKLPWEYWHPQILADIAKCVGVLVRIDKTTTDGEFGHFARVLIDVDLSVALPHQVGIEREGYHSWIELVYEYLPPFCPVCSSIGHHSYNCRRNPNQGKHEENFRAGPQVGHVAASCKRNQENSKADQTVFAITSKFKRNLEEKKRSNDVSKDDARKVKTPAPTKVWKPAEQKGNSIPVTRILNRINDELQQNFPQRVRDHESGKFVEVEDVVSSSDWSSSEDDFEVSNGHLPMVNWHASTSYQQISQPISVVFPDSPTHSYMQNCFELLSGLEENKDDTVRITEMTSNDAVSPKRITWVDEEEETFVIDNAKSSKNVTAWADLIGSDSEPEKIDTEIIDHSWRSNRNIQFAVHNNDANSDPEGWYTVQRRKKKYSPTPQMEPQVQVPSRQSRNYFPVGTRKSKRQVQLPKKYQPS